MCIRDRYQRRVRGLRPANMSRDLQVRQHIRRAGDDAGVRNAVTPAKSQCCHKLRKVYRGLTKRKYRSPLVTPAACLVQLDGLPISTWGSWKKLAKLPDLRNQLYKTSDPPEEPPDRVSPTPTTCKGNRRPRTPGGAAAMWGAQWTGRGWRDPALACEEDLPLLVSIPSTLRELQTKVRGQMHDLRAKPNPLDPGQVSDALPVSTSRVPLGVKRVSDFTRSAAAGKLFAKLSPRSSLCVLGSKPSQILQVRRPSEAEAAARRPPSSASIY
eukprot:TRINITY_DN1084_c0_g1_i11.p1 TRINITY_DN1084_c0_g1~~TRINITY_DN1084_c0_g1_i11.p1  ORF type:complete len:270 (-),score=14.89 TRINITY_DN1084_c0_g1_i11:45-854(-)